MTLRGWNCLTGWLAVSENIFSAAMSGVPSAVGILAGYSEGGNGGGRRVRFRAWDRPFLCQSARAEARGSERGSRGLKPVGRNGRLGGIGPQACACGSGGWVACVGGPGTCPSYRSYQIFLDLVFFDLTGYTLSVAVGPPATHQFPPA